MLFASYAPVFAVGVPFAVALVLALLGRRARLAAPWLAALAPLAVLIAGASALPVAWGRPAMASPWRSLLASSGSARWFSVGDVAIRLGWAVDSLAAIMLVVVGLVALCVVVFSAGYMHGDRGWVRYFALIALFTGSMTLLVIGDSFATLFLGWELVGACSYLLIGFWFEKPEAAAAAVKAFLTTRVGDVALLLGLAVLWTSTGSLAYEQVAAGLSAMGPGTLTLAACLIAVGALGKSAQFPLHAWLPDAMEGPTPVSALIHAATMVAAGVYLVARAWPLFEAAPAARVVLLAAGVVSAFGASLVAVVQRDIKKVLAYSTISQLGLMFAALGVGAWSAAFFHLVTHAAFKALLFLASGSVIHGSGTQDLHRMGALRKPMPWTFATWVVGCLALAGIPPLAGFFSKDALLESVWRTSPALGIVLLAASGITALYVARATRLAFFGPAAEGLHAHESPASMVASLVVLAVPAVGLGFAATAVSEVLHVEAEPLAIAISAAAVGAALIGGLIGWLSAPSREVDAANREAMGWVGDVLASAYRWDALVERAVVRPVVSASRTLWAFGDRLLADGLAEGAAALAQRFGAAVVRLQTGDAQEYAIAIAFGAAALLLLTFWTTR